MRYAAFAILAFGLPAFLPFACGASEGFHYVMANLAMLRLDPPEQEQLISMLKKHPCWERDFAPVVKDLEGEQYTRRVVGRAAYWPELLKEDPVYARPNWMREPGATLNLGVRLGKTRTRLPEEGDLNRMDMCLSQAIVNCRMVIRDEPNDADAAVALCWVLYLTGAIHQPCNGGCLYVDDVFPKGDDWATQIQVTSGESLHSYWDNALGAGFETRRDDLLLAELLSRPAVYVSGTGDPRAWVDESRKFWMRAVYSPRVLAVVESGNTEAVELSPEYIATARAILRGGITTAAARVANVLASDLSWRRRLPLGEQRTKTPR